MSTPTIGIVWNPSKTSREPLEAGLRRVLTTEQIADVHWCETSEDDPGVSATQEVLAKGADVVLAAGGDGTIRAVIEALAGQEREQPAELGIIPLGTGNLLARNLGLPLGDTAAAVESVLDPSATSSTIDVGWATTTKRYAFAVMAGFGIDAHMITETSEDLKSQVGWVAYLESLGRAVSASEVLDVTVTVDDQDAHTSSAHTLIVGNCGTVQGGITILPDADPTDGHLDLLVLNADSVFGWIDTVRNMAWDNGVKRLFGKGNTAASSKSVTHETCTRVEIELSEPRVFELDGDDIGETARVTVEIQPAAVIVRGT